ncbi:BldC family transcriptional regulator [Actinomadura formosensis]|uniref:BldC family transcriptional regulator n=1 Tax=Actinomadura formosensis TaxID=60706 RepID=UPI0008327EDA|nr:BldC family transcriptional regulator [Actinomadura formosensis]
MTEIEEDNLLTRAQVAALFNVRPRTVAEWGRVGRLQSIRTPGGHRRYRESEVRALLAGTEKATATSEGASA